MAKSPLPRYSAQFFLCTSSQKHYDTRVLTYLGFTEEETEAWGSEKTAQGHTALQRKESAAGNLLSEPALQAPLAPQKLKGKH
jgi:hypothetical protein